MTGDVQAMTREWTDGFRVRTGQARIPVSAMLELTRRCNLRCAHCYLGDQAAQHRRRGQERGPAEVKAALTEWAEAGCLYLLLTGGDPMLRPDFAEIYRHARELGMVVTVYCNGTLVTDEIVALFRELPPRKVEISIYGATPATHEAVTGVPGSHERAWNGIRRLQAAGIRVSLKTMLLTTNRHELEPMERQAQILGLEFRHDAALFPCLEDASPAPLAFRVAPAEAVRRDLSGPGRKEKWNETIRRVAGFPADERLYACAAGKTFFHADPFGGFSPCLLATRYRCEAAGRSFRELWEGELAAIRQRRRVQPAGGPLRGACTHCPAFNALETGDEERDSEYMKKTALLRYEMAMCPEAGDAR